MQALIRLLLEEQSDLGLHCLPIVSPSLQNLYDVHFKNISHIDSAIACIYDTQGTKAVCINFSDFTFISYSTSVTIETISIGAAISD